jgi:hypothetical protein
MTDIYRQELDIPEKRTAFGWLLLAMGGVMIFIAIIIFLQEAKYDDLINRRSWSGPARTTSSPAAVSADPGRVKEARERAKRLLFMVVIAFALVMVFVIVAIASHRAAERLKAIHDTPPKKTPFSDPWKEAGKRLQIDPEKEE